MKPYFRVIPRDLFNEAKLLKCLGQLVIESERINGRLVIHHDGDPFNVIQDEGTGDLYCANVCVWLDGRQIRLVTSYNSKENYPMWADVNDDYYQVFNPDGTLHPDFIKL